MACCNDHNATLGKKIKALRKHNGLSQVDLAYRLGYESTGTISLIERGLTGMRREKVYEAAKEFCVPAWVLFDDQDYTDEELAMYSDFHRLMKNKDSDYFNAVKALLKQSSRK